MKRTYREAVRLAADFNARCPAGSGVTWDPHNSKQLSVPTHIRAAAWAELPSCEVVVLIDGRVGPVPIEQLSPIAVPAGSGH